ncbi:MAG: GspE/PulE family protein, partial [Planctomycetota bacterium]
IVNGPTSSGKTTTLYCLLRELSTPGRKVMTVEDPVELHLDGLLQANIGTGMSFPEAMRAMLRNDLDVGMVSEMRDGESMRLLFQMANAGHLMLTAMHAPNAVTVLQRVLEFGEVEPRLLVENLLGILDQRLVGRSCPHCRRSRRITKSDAEMLRLQGGDRRRSAAYNEGCEECEGTGIIGRTVVGELLALTPSLRDAIEAKITSPEDLAQRLPEDTFTLRDDVLWRLFAKEVTPESASRALSV